MVEKFLQKGRKRDSRAKHFTHSPTKRDNQVVYPLSENYLVICVGKRFQGELLRKPCPRMSYRLLVKGLELPTKQDGEKFRKMSLPSQARDLTRVYREHQDQSRLGWVSSLAGNRFPVWDRAWT